MPYGDIVPLEFQHLSRYAIHKFRVSDAWWRPYRFQWTLDRRPAEIPTAAFCRVANQGQVSEVAFPEAANSGLYEAGLLLASTCSATTSVEKFLTPYRALESIAVRPAIEMRAIRHALAHSTSQLPDPAITGVLQKMFGGTSINFRK